MNRLLRSWPPGLIIRTLTLLGLLAAVVLLAAPARAGAPAQSRLQGIYYMPRQVILTGSSLDLEPFVRNFNAQHPDKLSQEPIRSIDLSYARFLRRGALECFPLTRRPTLVSNLYSVSSTRPLSEVVALLNRFAGTRPCGQTVQTEPQDAKATGAQITNASYPVYADLNYAVGRPPVSTSGDPWTIEGFDAGGSPAVAPGLFHDQWAFKTPSEGGISLYSGVVTSPTLVLTRTVSETGKHVRVGIFDTSPFSLTGPASATVTFKWLTLQVSHVFTPSFNLPAPTTPATPTVVADHGLFGASLIQAVAPDAKITLYRVLDKYGQGDLFALNAAVSSFISETLPLKAGLNGAVINLSLGVHPDPDLPPPAEISALETIMDLANGFDIAVVAASGNDSTAITVKPMQIPAVYPETIAVGGSNHARTRSCFSNAARIGAPAGDGSNPDGKSCAPWSWGASPPEPKHYLIGLSTSSATGYAYWMGTSFAAPLASGAAAVVQQHRGPGTTPGQVATSLYIGAVPTNGVQPAIKSRILNLRRSATHPLVFLPAVELLP